MYMIFRNGICKARIVSFHAHQCHDLYWQKKGAPYDYIPNTTSARFISTDGAIGDESDIMTLLRN